MEKEYAREAFIRFDTDGLGGAERAVLSLTASASASAIARLLDVWLAPDSEWSESTVTYANPPAGVTLPTPKRTDLPPDGSVVRMPFGTITSGTPYQIDITEMVRLRELLHREAVTDALTGLSNRRGFLSLAENGIQIASRMGLKATVLFADLDGFKTVNDTFGHEEGDRVLREAAEALRRTFRACDTIGRIGGDEFAVFMLHDGNDAVGDIRSRLLGVIEEINATGARGYRLSMSTGLSEWTPDNPVSLEALMAEADRRMYRNKEARRQGGAERP